MSGKDRPKQSKCSVDNLSRSVFCANVLISEEYDAERSTSEILGVIGGRQINNSQ